MSRRTYKKTILAFLLLCAGMLARAQDGDYEDSSAFFNAITRDDSVTLKKLMKETPGIWYANEENENLLMYAVRVSSGQSVKVLIPYYAHETLMSDENYSGQNVLDIAVGQKNQQILKLIQDRAFWELNDPANIDTLYMLAFSENAPVREGILSGRITLLGRDEDKNSLLCICAGSRSFSDRKHPESYYDDEQNRVRFARFLLDQHIDAAMTNEDGQTALFKAIDNDHTPLASLLIDRQAALNVQTSYENYPLLRAEQRDNKAIFAKLVAAGADLNILDDDGNTVLRECINDHKFDYAEILINAGADVNIHGKNGYTPLYEACDESNTELAALLIRKGADVNSRSSSYACTPLSVSLYPDNYDLVKLLLDSGADVNAKDTEGASALFSVDSTIDLRIVTMLLDHGADVNAPRTNGETPVLFAAYFGRMDLLTLYKKYNADFRATDKNGSTGIHYMIKGAVPATMEMLDVEFTSGHPLPAGMLELFIDEKVNINAQNKKGQTALMLAAEGEFDHPEYVTELLAHGAQVNIRDSYKQTALMYAVGRPRTVSAVLAAKPDMTLTASDGKTALDMAEGHCRRFPEDDGYAGSAQAIRAAQDNPPPVTNLAEAALFGYPDQVAALLARNAPLNQTDSNGHTAVYYAVLRHDAATLKTLISRGADVNECGSGDYTPLFLAISLPDDEIIDLLIAAGADVNKACYDGYSTISPLREAIGDLVLRNKPDLHAVKSLIKAGAAIEWKTSRGETELMYACHYSSPEVVQYLLDAGASIFAQSQGDYRKNSAFDVTSDKNRPLLQAKLNSLFKDKTMRSVDNLNVRSQPDSLSSKLLTLRKGSAVRVIETGAVDEYEGIRSCWVKVSTLQGAADKNGSPVTARTEGWVFAGYLQ